MSEEANCWACDDPEIVYTDILSLGWCEKCFTEIYLGDDE